MAVKVAVASSDGKFINSHFGRTKQFLIFTINNGKYEFLELRKNVPACSFGEHTENGLAETVKLLEDCNIVLASNIGLGAVEALQLKGIKAYSITGFIDQVLVKLGASRLIS
ncbi:MAG: NifB/NifX family molybdenum-iron cluster-binding protein [Bacillota bacterium]|nr:NifB/NifX family molybdenum-iron cluster-binding protein [Bacillota bacterium]